MHQRNRLRLDDPIQSRLTDLVDDGRQEANHQYVRPAGIAFSPSNAADGQQAGPGHQMKADDGNAERQKLLADRRNPVLQFSLSLLRPDRLRRTGRETKTARRMTG